MLKRKRWHPEEDALIQRMLGQGASLRDVHDALPDRTLQAVEKRVTRLNLQCRQTNKIFFQTIPTKDILDREEALKMLAGAAEMLHRGGWMGREELNRIRTLNVVIRNYFTIFNIYDRFDMINERVEKIEKRFHTVKKVHEKN